MKIQELPRVGQPGEPVVEPTRFAWVLMSAGREAELNKLMCTNISLDDHENLCRLDALGVTDIVCDDFVVYQDFEDQLRRSKDGYYKTGLMWKDNSAAL